MPEYPKRVKRLIREYAARAYEAELSKALGELERQFAVWRAGPKALRAGLTANSAGELSDHIHAFSRGPAREFWQRYNAGLDDMQVAHAIVTGLLPRDELPSELLEALQSIIAFYERDGAAPSEDTK